ncbi:MAG TPA: DNA-directed RNA polymerase subunit D [Candidatus Thermoplasmatota archaeon]|nr:DNA-directed RNA polymerase subunit D [Candidatus Thermoplasmatota archaeon]
MELKIEVQQLSDRVCKLVIEGVHPYFVNALRRTLMSEVPKLAIDKVTFYDNTSALFDEMIAHRIGLLPVPTDPSTLNRKGEVDADGKPTYLVRFTLTKEGPCTVYSGDLEPEDPTFKIVDPKVPIVELLEDQRLILEAEAYLGDGTQHAKWQVCSAAGYKYFPTATVDNRRIKPEQAKEAVARTPAGILGLEGGKLVILQPEEVNRADEAEKICGDGFKVHYDDRKFVFRFETDGALKAEDALLKALDLLKARFKTFQDAVADL